MDFFNIDGSTDKYARYKMPPIAVTHQDKKGGLTIIGNLVDVAKSLDRDPKVLFTFLQKECSTSGNFKTTALSGIITTNKLQSLVTAFIKQQVF